jgi:predicted nucleic acid-binding protein
MDASRLGDLLEELHRPVKQAARELIVLELYRQGEVSSGKAAELLGLGREQFAGEREALALAIELRADWIILATGRRARTWLGCRQSLY